jgi:hypothetical protein
MQAIEVKGHGVRRNDRIGEWLKPALLVAATLLAITTVLLASGALYSGKVSSGPGTYRAQGQTQQSQHGNLPGDDAESGASAGTQSGYGYLP